MITPVDGPRRAKLGLKLLQTAHLRFLTPLFAPLEIARKSIIDFGSDPLRVHGLAIPVRVQWKNPGAIVFRLLVDGVVCGTLDLPVR